MNNDCNELDISVKYIVTDHNDEKEAIEKVKSKYYDEYIKRDTYFFLGTTLSNHYISKNPFIVIGVFPLPMPPEHEQLSLF